MKYSGDSLSGSSEVDRMNILPKQNDKPRTIFIFGAGASYPDGVPLQADIIPRILMDTDPQLIKSQISKRIKRFLAYNFCRGDKYPSLEEVFGFIDFFVSLDMSLSKQWGTDKLRCLKSDLIKVIHYLISKNTNRSDNFILFWKTIKELNQEVGVITTNYDTLIEEAFDSIYPICLLDYCVDLINYRYPESLIPFDWWVDPKKPVEIFDGIIPTRIRLIKLHGSLNWKYCNCCGQVALTPWQHQINLKTDSYESFLDSQTTECPLDHNKLASLIQAPTHYKSFHNYIFSKLYDEATYLLRSASQLVFIGYSFPAADVHIRALIRQSYKENGRIIVVNKSRAKDLRHRYESLAQNIEYYAMPFERFVRSGIFRDILSSDKSIQPAL